MTKQINKKKEKIKKQDIFIGGKKIGKGIKHSEYEYSKFNPSNKFLRFLYEYGYCFDKYILEFVNFIKYNKSKLVFYSEIHPHLDFVFEQPEGIKKLQKIYCVIESLNNYKKIMLSEEEIINLFSNGKF